MRSAGWDGEVEPVIMVACGRVASRSIRFRQRLGSWRGLRFTYGKNMAGCTRTVLEQDVYTALCGFGAGLPVTTAIDDLDELAEVEF